MIATVLLLVVSLAACRATTSHVYPPDPTLTNNRAPLYFGLMQSFGGDYDGSGSLAGVHVALDLINSDASLLPGYRLHYTFMDSQVRKIRYRCREHALMD